MESSIRRVRQKKSNKLRHTIAVTSASMDIKSEVWNKGGKYLTKWRWQSGTKRWWIEIHFIRRRDKDCSVNGLCLQGKNLRSSESGIGRSAWSLFSRVRPFWLFARRKLRWPLSLSGNGRIQGRNLYVRWNEVPYFETDSGRALAICKIKKAWKGLCHLGTSFPSKIVMF